MGGWIVSIEKLAFMVLSIPVVLEEGSNPFEALLADRTVPRLLHVG